MFLRYSIAMRLSALSVFVLVLITALVTGQGNQTGRNKTSPPERYPSSAPVPIRQNQEFADIANQSNQNPSHWYASLRSPEWWLVLAAFLTLLFVAMQTVATRKAAGAAADSVEAVKRQSTVMERQAETLEKQTRAVRRQALSMRRQTTVLRKSADAAEKAATAAMQGAQASEKSASLVVARERARVKVEVDPVGPQSQPPQGGQAVVNAAICRLANYGPSPAFIDNFAMRYLLNEEPDVRADHRQCRRILYGEALPPGKSALNFFVPLEPSPSLTDMDIQRVREGKEFLHVYGYVTYRDIFGEKRSTSIHMRWAMRWGMVIGGAVTEWWEPAGPDEDNDET